MKVLYIKSIGTLKYTLKKHGGYNTTYSIDPIFCLFNRERQFFFMSNPYSSIIIKRDWNARFYS